MNDVPPGFVRGRPARVAWIAGPGIVLTGWLALAQGPVERPVPLNAEPSQHQILANADVRLFRVEVAPRAATQLHEHANDFVWIALGDAEITDTARGESETRLEARDGTMTFRPRGIVHTVRNERDAPFRNVTIEFLRPQTGGRNLCGQVLRAQPLDCPSSAAAPDSGRKGHSMVPKFETDQTHISLLILEPKARFTIKPSQSPPVLVALEGTDAEALVEIKIPGGAVGKGNRPLRSGYAMEVPSGIAVELHNSGGAPARFVVLAGHAPR